MPVQEFTPIELESEEWRQCEHVGIVSAYEVSNLGRVRRVRKDGSYRLRKPTARKPPKSGGGGYLFMSFPRGQGKNKLFSVHRLVALAFLGEEPPGHQVNHIDANKQNARVTNLEYVTPQQNIAHAHKLGLMKGYASGPNPKIQGEKSPTAKLTSEDVLNIRRSILNGIPATLIAKQYQVTSMTISCIKSGKSWDCLPELRDEVKALGRWKTRHNNPRGLNAK